MDKVQKILNKITTRKLCTMDEHMAFYNDKAKEDYRFLSEIEELIKALQKEPVSEDLEEEIGKYCSNPENFITYIDVGFKHNPIEKDDIPLIIKAIKFGANWQERKDEKNIGELQWNAHAEGWDECKQEMMKDAIDTTIKQGCTELVILIKGLNEDKFSFGDKVKIIVVKED